jgi:hypothetical protein
MEFYWDVVFLTFCISGFYCMIMQARESAKDERTSFMLGVAIFLMGFAGTGVLYYASRIVKWGWESLP